MGVWDAVIWMLGMCVLAGGGVLWYGVVRKHVSIWIGAYLSGMPRRIRARQTAHRQGTVHVLLCVVDHFEPIAAGSTGAEEQRRMAAWLDRYPVLAKNHRDSTGRPVQHTWFYPGENYHQEYLDGLVCLCRQGLGEIELHLHHGDDTEATLRAVIEKAITQFAEHGALLSVANPPRRMFGFIHGNMALANSMNDSARCGVNGELAVLKEAGCYADFSLPTAPCVSQARMINIPYYATSDPSRPKSHNTGVEVEVGKSPSGDLMIIPGPLALDWSRRKLGVIPRIENGEIQDSNPGSAERVALWVRQHVHVIGRPEWVIVKVSCHGAEDRSQESLLGEPADQMYNALEQQYRDRPGYQLHYVTARELYNVIKAAEAGKSGDPTQYYDYVLPPYRTHGTLSDALRKRESTA